MFKQGDSLNRQKINACSFQQVLRQKFELVFVSTHEILRLRGFILKSTKKAQVLQKDGSRDFQNSIPFERSACRYVKLLEIMNVFNTSTLKENFLQKPAVPFFS